MFERVFTVSLPNNQGPAVIPLPLSLPGEGEFDIEAWIGNFGSSNCYIIEGLHTDVTAALQGFQISTLQTLDVLLALTGTGKVRRGLPDADIEGVSVLFELENTSGQSQTVTVRVCERGAL